MGGWVSVCVGVRVRACGCYVYPMFCSGMSMRVVWMHMGHTIDCYINSCVCFNYSVCR